MNGVKSKRSGLGSGCCCALRAGESARTNSIVLKTSTSIFFLVIPPRLRFRLHTLPRFRYFNKARRSSVSRRGKDVGKPQVGPRQVSECAKDDARTQIAAFGRVTQRRACPTMPIGAHYTEATVIAYFGSVEPATRSSATRAAGNSGPRM